MKSPFTKRNITRLLLFIIIPLYFGVAGTCYIIVAFFTVSSNIVSSIIYTNSWVKASSAILNGLLAPLLLCVPLLILGIPFFSGWWLFHHQTKKLPETQNYTISLICLILFIVLVVGILSFSTTETMLIFMAEWADWLEMI